MGFSINHSAGLRRKPYSIDAMPRGAAGDAKSVAWCCWRRQAGCIVSPHAHEIVLQVVFP